MSACSGGQNDLHDRKVKNRTFSDDASGNPSGLIDSRKIGALSNSTPCIEHRAHCMARLLLGPIVGHTDHYSSRVWIRVSSDPSSYVLRVRGVGMFPFLSTETNLEFGTAVAFPDGLRPEWEYRYQVLRNGRVVANADGQFRTMPVPGSGGELQFAVISCSHQRDEGAWKRLAAFIKDAQPRFLLCIGDQVYLDSGRGSSATGDVWADHRDSSSAERRTAMVEKYQENWSRDYVAEIFATIPTYMMWDDHEIRDGWGSWASDSATLADKYRRGEHITAHFREYFYDARDVYWHFQGCRNPRKPLNGEVVDPTIPNYVSGLPPRGIAAAMPYAFRCGATVVLVTDSRGERDVFRPDLPILGARQWQFVSELLANLPADADALMIVTPAPIVCMDPRGQTQSLVGERTDDVALYQRGDLKSLLELMQQGSSGTGDLVLGGIGGWINSRAGVQANLGSFRVDDIDDARDQWSNKFSQSEQERLIRCVGAALTTNRAGRDPRGALFIGGDLHAGGLYDLVVDDPPYRTQCLISSGISTRADASKPLLYTLLDDAFTVATGIQATLGSMVTDYNFGIVHIVSAGGTPSISPALSHEGSATAWGIRVSSAV